MDEKEIQNLVLDSLQENYVPPPQKSVSEIIATDANDNSLNRWVITWFENLFILFRKQEFLQKNSLKLITRTLRWLKYMHQPV